MRVIAFLLILLFFITSACSDRDSNPPALSADGDSDQTALEKIQEAERRQTSVSKSPTPTGMAKLSNQFDEGFRLSEGARLAVSEYFSEKGKLPADIRKTSLVEYTTSMAPMEIVLKGEYTPEIFMFLGQQGVITLNYNKSYIHLEGVNFFQVTQKMTPTVTKSGAISWSCSLPKYYFEKFRNELPKSCNELH